MMFMFLKLELVLKNKLFSASCSSKMEGIESGYDGRVKWEGTRRGRHGVVQSAGCGACGYGSSLLFFNTPPSRRLALKVATLVSKCHQATAQSIVDYCSNQTKFFFCFIT